MLKRNKKGQSVTKLTPELKEIIKQRLLSETNFNEIIYEVIKLAECSVPSAYKYIHQVGKELKNK